MLTWSYDSLVPSYRLSRETRNVLRVSDARYIAITDPEMMVYKELSDGIPGFIQVCITTTHSKYCNILFSLPYAATRCNTLQHAATRCNTPSGMHVTFPSYPHIMVCKA